MPSPSKSTPGARRRVLIVDDHPMVRHGIHQRLAIESDLTVSAEVGSIAEALEAVARDCPDVVVVDISMGGRNGMELIKDLHVLHPHLPLLAFSMHDEARYAARVL